MAPNPGPQGSCAQGPGFSGASPGWAVPGTNGPGLRSLLMGPHGGGCRRSSPLVLMSATVALRVVSQGCGQWGGSAFLDLHQKTEASMSSPG